MTAASVQEVVASGGEGVGDSVAATITTTDATATGTIMMTAEGGDEGGEEALGARTTGGMTHSTGATEAVAEEAGEAEGVAGASGMMMTTGKTGRAAVTGRTAWNAATEATVVGRTVRKRAVGEVVVLTLGGEALLTEMSRVTEVENSAVGALSGPVSDRTAVLHTVVVNPHIFKIAVADTELYDSVTLSKWLD